MDPHYNFYLIRHGKSQMNESWIMNGQLHDPLNQLGHMQAKTVAQRLSKVHFDAIWSSPLDRARETAEAIQQFHPELDIQFADGLKERSFGTFEGKPISDLRAIAQEHFQCSPSHCLDRINEITQAGIECDPEVAARFFERAGTIQPTAEQQNLCVVSHGAFIRCIIWAITQVDNTRYFDTFRPIENTAITILRWFPATNKWIIVTLNDHAHILNTQD